MKKVCIINTGGTLSMRPSPQGYQPSPGYLAEQMQAMPELAQAPMPGFEILEHEQLIDSANMDGVVWQKVSRDIQKNLHNFDGFVILHGTDTMAYTASALAFMLDGITKPVILTGAQLPLGQIRNDARENLKTAMMLATEPGLGEVCLFFGDHLFRGCRSTKISATRFDAFDSPNYPPLATVGTEIKIFTEHIRTPTVEDELKINPIEPADVSTFRIFPGMSMDILEHFLKRPLKGIVLETYGDGNGPTSNPDFMRIVRKATDNGMVILGCTQCLHGGMTQTGYATGTAMTEAGVIPGRDMTVEAALTKMLFLFSNFDDTDEIKRMLGQNLVGELTEVPN